MSKKQAINDKLESRVATYLRCGGVINNQIKKGLLLSLSVKKIKIGKYLAKLQGRTWLSRALSSSFSSVVARCTNVKFCTSVKIWQNYLWVCGITLWPLSHSQSAAVPRWGAQAPKSWQGPKFSRTLETMWSVDTQKMSKSDATRCQILRLKCTEFDFRRGSAPEPAGGALQRYSRPRSWI